MWILDWLPFWVFHLVVLVGLAGLAASLVLKFVPFISTYRLPIQVAAIAILYLVFIWKVVFPIKRNGKPKLPKSN
jgi:hypothetical protein